MVISKIRKRLRPKKLSKPKVTLSRFGQLIFTFKEVTKLGAKVNLTLLVLIFVINAIWGFSLLPGLYLEKLILDRLVESIGNPDWEPLVRSIGVLVGLRVLVELARNFISRISQLMRRIMSRLFRAELELLLSKKLAELDLATLEDAEFKNKFAKIERDYGQRAWQMMMPLTDIPNYLVGLVTSLGILVFLHPLVALAIFIVSLPQLFVNSKYIKKGYELRVKIAPLTKVWGWLTFYLLRNRSYVEMKILDLPGHLAGQLRTTQKKVLKQQNELIKKRELSGFGSYLPLVAFELVISIWLVFLVIVERITLGSLELYRGALRNAQMNLTSLVSSFLQIYENYLYVADLVWFLNLTPEIEQGGGRKKVNLDSSFSLDFKNVWFRYKQDQAWVLKDVDFSISSGEKIAIVGENGAGKSTLIKLLSRFYDPQKGKITVEGINLPELNLKLWRKNLAVLFQEFEKYPFSVADTVGYGEVGRINNLTDIKESISKTDMTKFVENLPLKYKNPVDPVFDKGVKPSAGQWQRFGISRILFRKNAKILVMDEPTSNVDPEAEEKIFKELLRMSEGKILIFVTQRFSTVRLADRIFVVDKGKIIETGTHRELMKKEGKYARLFKLQAKGYR